MKLLSRLFAKPSVSGAINGRVRIVINGNVLINLPQDEIDRGDIVIRNLKIGKHRIAIEEGRVVLNGEVVYEKE